MRELNTHVKQEIVETRMKLRWKRFENIVVTAQWFSNFPDEISKIDEKQGIIRGKIIREPFMRFHRSDVCGGF